TYSHCETPSVQAPLRRPLQISSTPSTHDCPCPVRLLASTPRRGLRTAVHEDLLGEVGAAEPALIVIIIVYANLPIITAIWIAPLVGDTCPAGIETVVIRLVSVALVLAIEILCQC